MSAVAERPAVLSGYEDFLGNLPDAPQSVRELRAKGLARFEEVGFPTTRQEEWRHTSVAPISRATFQRATGESTVKSDHLQPFRVPECDELVFINGRFQPELSSEIALPEGAYAGSLAAAINERPDVLETYLGKHADADHPFVALNSAHISDGALIFVPRNKSIERPLHLLFISTLENGGAVMSYPRNLIVAEESAEVTVLETYGGFSGESYFTCPVTEIVGHPNSVIDHYKLEQESGDAFHVATQKVYLENDSNFFSHSISHGASLVRNDIQGMLDGTGIECTLNGLYLPRGKQHIDNQMRIDHAKPHCNSYELYKGILEDDSRAVFNGRIFVHQDAQKTDAKQSNRNLLLSEGALVHSNPQLEIFADDVRCTHGSTTGHLEDEAVFYLRSRGIGEEAAKSLLTYAFAGEVLDEIRLQTVKKDLEEFLFTRLPKGDVVRQAV